ncbi:methyltransferase domain-containing protein [Colwellia sp. MEBiC06753]
MKSALAYREPSTPQQWQELPMGSTICQTINQAIAPWCSKFFGYHLLKIGALSSAIDCSQSPIKHQVNVSHCRELSSVIADIDDLPFIEHSVDVCILGHALEFTTDPHHVLREASRVLIPNGYMVITGYNPFSFAGLNKLMPYRRKQSPWREQFFTPMRVKDWLALMGYEVLDDNRLLFSMLSGRDEGKKSGKLNGYWQRFAGSYLPALGSIYVIVAKKRVHPLTPIKPKWRLRPSLQPARVTPMNSSKVHGKYR